jgi:hypothetical protein
MATAARLLPCSPVWTEEEDPLNYRAVNMFNKDRKSNTTVTDGSIGGLLRCTVSQVPGSTSAIYAPSFSNLI